MRFFNISKQVITTLIVLASFTKASPTNRLPAILRIENHSEKTVIPSLIRRSATFFTSDSLGLLSILEDNAGRHGFRYRNVRVAHVQRRQFKRASFERYSNMF